ncbi:hypothetical protein ACTA71_002820 [Dictyostelium dimigraforme]
MINNDSVENLFFKVYRNKYLNYLIFSYLAIYREYNSIDLGFDSKEIIKYKDYLSYISKIKYSGEEPIPLENYSLPILKTFEVGFFIFKANEDLKNPFRRVDPQSIPNSVEEFIFPNHDSSINITFFDLFPESITTFENVNIKRKIDINIPRHVTKLTFSSLFNLEIKEKVLPQSLTHLDFGKYWENDNYNLEPWVLPQSLKILSLGNLKQSIGPNLLPPSLTDLTLSFLPSSFENFPTTLKKLTIDTNEYYNSHIELKFNVFNHLKSIETLVIKSNSLLIEINSIPQSVTKLDISVRSLHSLHKYMLPKSLKSLKIRVFIDSFKLLKDSLPDGLLELDCLYNGLNDLEIGLLPNSLKSLSLCRINKKGFNKIIKNGYFSNNLNYLNLGTFNQQIQPNNNNNSGDGGEFQFTNNSLPINLKQLNFGEIYNKQIIPNSLPPNLKKIIFSPFFNQKLLNNSFPSKLIYLEFGNNYNNQIPVGVLPLSLEILIFGNRFNQIILAGSLPSSISTLRFGIKNESTKGRFNCPIEENVLPSSLVHLEIYSMRYSFKINESFLPKSLKFFNVSDNIKKNNLHFFK